MPTKWLSVCTNIIDIIIKYLVINLFEHPLQIYQNPGTSNWLQYKDSYELKYNNSEILDI